jgi:hypothetical protein
MNANLICNRRWLEAATFVAACVFLTFIIPPRAAAETLGYVLTTYSVALRETPAGKEECPTGFVADDHKQWAAMYDNPAAQEKHLLQYGNRNVRGVDGENVFWFPQSAKDPLPYKEAQGTVSYGLNLDGTTDGHATANTCVHQKFTSPEGKVGIDNQFYRLAACITTFRKTGWMDEFTNKVDMVRPMNRYLLEVANVRDRMNDDSVEVNIYKGQDALTLDGDGHAIPYTTQHIDVRNPYVHHTRGRIVDGVLITDPISMRLPMEQTVMGPGERQMDQMRLELKLSPTGADGVMAGYMDTEFWWQNMAKIASLIGTVITFSGPATYDELNRLADGNKDKNGVCHSISSAYSVSWVPAYIVHSGPSSAITAKRESMKTLP